MSKTILTQAQLREILSYDAVTGEFRWLRSRGGKALAGTIAGSVNRRGYVEISVGCSKWLGHRLAWLYAHGRVPKAIDHINGIGADNRLENLREATQGLNMANTRKRSNNTSGFKGVSWCRDTSRWAAQIRKDGRKYTIGRYDTAEQAAEAYSIKAAALFGEFARAG